MNINRHGNQCSESRMSPFSYFEVRDYEPEYLMVTKTSLQTCTFLLSRALSIGCFLCHRFGCSRLNNELSETSKVLGEERWDASGKSED